MRRCAKLLDRRSTTLRSSLCATSRHGPANSGSLDGADFEANLDGFSPNVQDIKAELDPRRGLYGTGSSAEAGQPAVVAYEADPEHP